MPSDRHHGARTRPQSATTPVIAANGERSMPGVSAAALSTSTKLTPSTIGPMYSREPVEHGRARPVVHQADDDEDQADEHRGGRADQQIEFAPMVEHFTLSLPVHVASG